MRDEAHNKEPVRGESVARILPPKASRREFIAGAAALVGGVSSIAGSTAFAAPSPSEQNTSRTRGSHMPENHRFVYVGTYSVSQADSASNGKGIYLFEHNPETGAFLHPRLAAESANPSWLVLHPSRKYLYTINEISDFDGHSGAVSAYAMDASTGALRPLNQVSSMGAGPAHMSIDHAGRHLLVANYAGGSIAVIAIRDDGSLGQATDTRQDTGSVGSKVPTNAPRGSFAFSGHDAPHAHCIIPSPDDRFILHTDLGQDRIYIYRFDMGSGKLQPAAVPFVSCPTGDGPRHLVFHPNGKWLYSIQEEASTIEFFHYDAVTGGLRREQMVSSLPETFAGTSFTSEILVSADGRFLYGGNRLADTVAAFSIGTDGRLQWIGEASTMGDYPRHVAIDPGGRFLYSANQRSDSITCFRLDQQTGKPVFTDDYIAQGTPACIVFL